MEFSDTFLTEIITTRQEFSSEQRSELLEQVEELSQQAALPEKEQRKGIIKALLSRVVQVVGFGASLAEIAAFFGITAAFFGL